jgi:hypothetical protein
MQSKMGCKMGIISRMGVTNECWSQWLRARALNLGGRWEKQVKLVALPRNHLNLRSQVRQNSGP